jgi:hypothetical protein
MTRKDLDAYIESQKRPAPGREKSIPADETQKLKTILRETFLRLCEARIAVTPEQFMAAVDHRLRHTLLGDLVSVSLAHVEFDYYDPNIHFVSHRVGYMIDAGTSEHGLPYIDVIIGAISRKR